MEHHKKESYSEELTGHQLNGEHCKKRIKEMSELIADEVPERISKNIRL